MTLNGSFHCQHFIRDIFLGSHNVALADYYIQSYDEIPEHRYEELKHHGERS